jgi:hypothetical protein
VRGIKAGSNYISELNEFGMDGWELVSIIHLSEYQGRTGALEFVLKRPYLINEDHQ